MQWAKHTVLYSLVDTAGAPASGRRRDACNLPIEREHAGTQSDPIPWVYGMDSYNGKYYSYEGKTYLCKSDMLPCVWASGTAGLWQWEVVS